MEKSGDLLRLTGAYKWTYKCQLSEIHCIQDTTFTMRLHLFSKLVCILLSGQRKVKVLCLTVLLAFLVTESRSSIIWAQALSRSILWLLPYHFAR